MPKLNCILNILFNNEELTPAEKIKTFHMIETKWGITVSCQARILTLYSRKEKEKESMFEIHVQYLDQCLKYFKILLVSKS